MCFTLGSVMVYWGSRKHNFVALITLEAGYIAACEACIVEVWLRKLIYGLFDQVPESTIIYCDNQSCIRLSEHPMFHEWSKHIEIKNHFIRDKVQEGEVKFQYIPTDEQTANILTKPLSRIKFAYLRDKLGIEEITPLDGSLGWVGALTYHWFMDSHFSVLKNGPRWAVPCSESGLRFMTDRHFPVWKMVKIERSFS